MQRRLPRPSIVDTDALLKHTSEISDPFESSIAKEMALLVIHDALKYSDPEDPTIIHGPSQPLETFDDDALNKARLEIALELPSSGVEERQRAFEKSWAEVHPSLPGLSNYSDDEVSPESQKEPLTVSSLLFHNSSPRIALIPDLRHPDPTRLSPGLCHR